CWPNNSANTKKVWSFWRCSKRALTLRIAEPTATPLQKRGNRCNTRSNGLASSYSGNMYVARLDQPTLKWILPNRRREQPAKQSGQNSNDQDKEQSTIIDLYFLKPTDIGRSQGALIAPRVEYASTIPISEPTTASTKLSVKSWAM